MRLVIKVCGVRRAEDAVRAAELGASYVGCVLALDSPRRASLAEVREVVASLQVAPSVESGPAPVLVFRDASFEEVLAATRATGVSRVQVHGATAADLAALAAAGLSVHRVFALAPDASELPVLDPAPHPDRPALLDVGRGGSGEVFDWRLLSSGAPPATLVAGGITPDNVHGLLPYGPYGLDVSSGIEERPGRKDPGAMNALFAALEGEA